MFVVQRKVTDGNGLETTEKHTAVKFLMTNTCLSPSIQYTPSTSAMGQAPRLILKPGQRGQTLYWDRASRV